VDVRLPGIRLEEQESPNVIRFTVQPNSRQPHVNEGPAVALLPEPPPLLTASEEVVMDGYDFTVISAVTGVRSTSTARKSVGSGVCFSDLVDVRWPGIRLEEQESPNVIRFTVQPNPRQPHVNEGPAVALLPEPPPLLTASEEVVMDGYAFTVLSPVTSVRSTSTRVDRISPVVVPPYTLAVEPKQDLQNLSKPRKPFDVLLRVHSYATEPGQTRVGVVVPK